MKAKSFRKTFPMLPAIALMAATFALTAAFPARATTFIKDVMLIGGTYDETTTFRSQYQAQGWSVILYDLNHGCTGSTDYIFLLYKTEEDTDGDRDYITGFYIKQGASGVTTTLPVGDKTYTLTPYAGGAHFISQKGDLNSNAGGDSIHLYYIKDNSSGTAITTTTFNTTKSGALGANGGSTGYDLNAGAGGDYVYMHVSSAVVTYGITYNFGGGTLSSANPSIYTANTATFTLNEPTRAGYTFTGWTWDGQTTPTKPVTIAKGSTGNKSYTANWILNTYNITCDLAGGTLSPANPSTYTVNTATFTLSNPTRTGYTFAGWTGTGLSSAQTTVTIARGSTGNRTYTANWTPIAYTISYNLNSGTNASGNPATYTIETATFTLANPTRIGYTFTGWTWSGQSTPAKTVTISQGSTGNKYYAANWNANPKGSFDACEGFANYITLSGWAYDPDEPSLSLSILVQVFRGDGGPLLSEHSLTADLPRADVNSRYGITGQHGFRTTIIIAEAGSCNVKAWALDSSDNSLRTQVGATKTAATTLNANVVQLDYIPKGENLKFVTYEAQDGDVLVGSTPYNVGIVIADGARVTLFGAHVDNIDPSKNASAIRCRGNATLVLASGTENSATGNRYLPGVQVGPPGTTLVVCGGGTLNASNNDMSLPALYGQLTHESAAGIGSFLGGNCGDIVIEGGTINATGGHGSPGIGASPNSSCGSVSISGGVSRVTATAGEDAPSSIGPGIGGSCGAVTIGGVEVGLIAQSPCTYEPKLNFVLGFDGNGAEGSTSGQLFTQDVAQSLNGPTFSAPSNWEFTGWNTSSNGNGTAYAAGQSITLATNMTLFAQWKKTFTLSNDTGEVTLGNGDVLTGTGGMNTHVTIADGATVTLIGVDITKTGGKNWAGITCEGDATIILVGDNAVTGGILSPGISVPAGKTLTIQGDGSLAATGGPSAAGVGGGHEQNCGNVVIADGVGRVTATAGYGAPYSIGQGSGSMLSCGTVTISGVETGPLAPSPYIFAPSVPCTVYFDANGGTGGMADQTFSCGVPQSLAACTFTAPGDYLFGGWNTAADGTGTAYANGLSITVSGDMTLYAQWSFQPVATVTLNLQSGEVTLRNGDVLTGTGGINTRVTIADGATVVLSGVTITGLDWAGITCAGDATIILAGDNAVEGGAKSPGIFVPAGKTLTIQGDGSLSATGHGAAGIGGGPGQSCGNIVIAGGTITATSNDAAGIGTGEGFDTKCGNITIGVGITSLVAVGTPSIGGENNPTITIAPGLVSEGSLSGGTFTLTPAKGYERWSLDNGVSGAWDATDAFGIHNVFRYAFNKPTGAFTNPPLLSITFDGGQPIVLTPPLVNTNGYNFGLLAYDALTNVNPSAYWLLSPDGTNAVPGNLPARFFRLGADEGNIDDK